MVKVDNRQSKDKERKDFREGRIYSPRTPRRIALNKPDTIGRKVMAKKAKELVVVDVSGENE